MSMQSNRDRPMRVKVGRHEQVYDGLFGDIERYKIEYDLFNGDTTEATREISHTKDVVSVFLFDPEKEEVILRERFQFATFERGRRHGWIRETFSKKIRAREIPDERTVRDLMKEFNLRIDTIAHIATFFSAADRLTQKVFLYYAEGRLRRGEDDDEVGDAESRPYRIRLRRFFERLAEGRFEDPKVIAAGHWLRAERLRQQDHGHEHHPGHPAERPARRWWLWILSLAVIGLVIFILLVLWGNWERFP